MRKTLTYSSFIIASFLVVAVFITATTYIQLGLAVALYPLLILFAFKIFPRKSHRTMEFTVELPKPAPKTVQTVNGVTREKVEVVDVDKRTFLKLIGTVGITFFLSSFLGKRADTLLSRGLGTAPASEHGASGAETLANGGYKISEVDENRITYYGFLNKDGGWLIMRVDTDTNTFRYAKGDTDFPGNWSRRENLKYDYFSNLF